MKKYGLSEWAQIAEVLGVIGVIVSLLFVAYSVNQNTEALQGSNGNILFERHAELQSAIVNDPSLAEIVVKLSGESPELTPVASIRWERYQLNMLDIWAMAFNRYRQDLIGAEQWNAWDEYFAGQFAHKAERIDRAFWEKFGYGYDPDFWAHVEGRLFDGS